jgi:hypothetical protein
MTPFEELTLGEVLEMRNLCLDGKAIDGADPMAVAGAVMYMHRRRANPQLTWADFLSVTAMHEITTFSTANGSDALDPTKVGTN